MPPSILEIAKDLMIAQIAAGGLSPGDIQEALQQTYASLMALKVQVRDRHYQPRSGR